MERVMLVGLMRIDLRGGRVIRLCDGGFLDFAGEQYTASDATFGTLAAVESMTEGVGDEAPAFKMSFFPKDTAAAAALSQPGYQGSRVRFWTGEIDEFSGTLLATPQQHVEAETDMTTLKIGKGSRILEMDCVSRAERLFLKNEGNTMSARQHRSIFASEAGMDNATGTTTVVAWGVQGPPRGYAYGSGGGGFGGGGGALDDSFRMRSR